MDYDANMWRDQVVDFVKEVVMSDDMDLSVAIAGTSLGGLTAMNASSDDRIKEHVKACILVNATGKFCPSKPIAETQGSNPILKAVAALVQKMLIGFFLKYAKQSKNSEHILKQVYSIDSSNVDAELVESIQRPAQHSMAAEVFQRMVSQHGQRPQAYLDDILEDVECPVLLAWGDRDPWIKTAVADEIERLHAKFHGKSHGEEAGKTRMKRVSINAGHCPHDEAPEAVNAAIFDFIEEVISSQKNHAIEYVH
ncbi:hypothetical protein ACHAWF_009176 [Thalassiosira exigua]